MQSRAFPDISANGANYIVAVCWLFSSTWVKNQSHVPPDRRRIRARLWNVLLLPSQRRDLYHGQ